jgi:TolB-like protein
MLGKSQAPFAAIVLSCFFTQASFAMPSQIQKEQKKKLAVLKVTYVDFTKDEQEMVNTAFYEHLARDERIAVITETQSRAELLPLGIEPTEINDEAGYIHAGQVLRVDYILVGNMEKVGDFVEVTFRVFTMPRGIPQKDYPGGKTLDLFVKQEIPKIVEDIQRDLELSQITQLPTGPDTVQVAFPKPPAQKEIVEGKKSSKRKKWPLIAIGGAVVTGGTVVAVLLSSGGDEGGTAPRGLPRPPVVP